MKLKRFIELFIFFFFFGIVTCQSQASIPKVEKIYKNVPELIIKDSLFLCGIDVAGHMPAAGDYSVRRAYLIS